mmetsp:Transcript_6430/g.15486  ORF Transcript_6430/g.15486 Transcript_6430/m.15486 type:complete len:217 (-) Transcript_6430:1142-1792(-)
MAMPSKVAVPRPSSSRMTSEWRVAWRRMRAVSSSSTRKVESPAMMASLAPTRVKTRSTGLSRQASAGTQQPRCAMSTVRHACRSSVDLPPMLGPVTSSSGGWPAGASASAPASAPASVPVSVPMEMSLGMQSLDPKECCTHGLTPAVMARKGVSLIAKVGRHMCGAAETAARLSRQSSSAAAPTPLRHSAKREEKSPKSLLATPPRARSCSALPSI